jgi:hypothetical protein
LPPLPQGGRWYTELNLTSKRIVHHWDLHGGWIGRLARRGVEMCFQASIKQTGVKIESPEELQFHPELLDRGMGRITRWLLKWLDYKSIARRRRVNYLWLANRLSGSNTILLRPSLPAGAVPLFLPILVDDKFRTVEALAQEKIEAIPVWGIHHPHLPRGKFSGTEFLVEHAVEIPLFQDLTERHLERIAQAVIRHAQWPGYSAFASEIPKPEPTELPFCKSAVDTMAPSADSPLAAMATTVP